MQWNALVDAYVHQLDLGDRQGGTFISKALDETQQEMRDRFPDKNDLSGFGWDPTSKMWTVEPDVWEKLIETHNLWGLGWNEKEQVLNQPLADVEPLIVPSEEASRGTLIRDSIVATMWHDYIS
ncbi:Myb/SANT-like DNA-binding domain protein [Senna tora]|uniref:Myb/SANT-like DNA-binding domain protein n=1 Tax=Senna tora TaxID=362788 RepID=A0A834TGS0_9FABA|nr:Myb/SANT-like DNA-binding domain protein [Senna tora]